MAFKSDKQRKAAMAMLQRMMMGEGPPPGMGVGKRIPRGMEMVYGVGRKKEAKELFRRMKKERKRRRKSGDKGPFYY